MYESIVSGFWVQLSFRIAPSGSMHGTMCHSMSAFTSSPWRLWSRVIRLKTVIPQMGSLQCGNPTKSALILPLPNFIAIAST